MGELQPCFTGASSIEHRSARRNHARCLEYIVVHEMIHLLEPTHNAHFVALMDQLIPHWRVCRDELNRLPVCHEKWTY